jgi:hypothetical protein
MCSQHRLLAATTVDFSALPLCRLIRETDPVVSVAMNDPEMRLRTDAAKARRLKRGAQGL